MNTPTLNKEQLKYALLEAHITTARRMKQVSVGYHSLRKAVGGAEIQEALGELVKDKLLEEFREKILHITTATYTLTDAGLDFFHAAYLAKLHKERPRQGYFGQMGEHNPAIPIAEYLQQQVEFAACPPTDCKKAAYAVLETMSRPSSNPARRIAESLSALDPLWSASPKRIKQMADCLAALGQYQGEQR